MPQHTRSRRRFLQRSAAAGLGLGALALVGCGDGDDEAAAAPAAAPEDGDDQATPDAAAVADEQAATPPSAAEDPPRETEEEDGQNAPERPPETEEAGDPAAPTRVGWERLQPASAPPPPRANPILAFDPSSERLLLHGGRDAGGFGDLWAYEIATATWTELPAGAEAPAPRWAHAGVVDPASGDLVIFGGQGAGGFFDDVWRYPAGGAGWQLLSQGTGPNARYGLGFALTPRRELIISHGFTNSGRFDDTWTLDLETGEWRDVSPAGARPGRRCLHACAFDELRERLVLFGGQDNGNPFLGDTWILEGGEWREITGPGPSARRFPTLIADTGVVWLYGGLTADGASDELWALDLESESWRRVDFSGAPAARHSHAAVRDPEHRSTYVAAGRDAEPFNDLWRLG